MPGLSPYTSTLPYDILLDTGMLYLGSNPFGASRGGLSFDPAKVIRNIPFDLKRAPLLGLDRVTEMLPVIEGTFIELGSPDFQNFETGATNTFASATAVTGIITPKKAGVLFAAGDYLTNLRLVFQRANDGGYVQVRFPKAVCKTYGLSGKDTEEAEVKATFEARLDITASGATIYDAPYLIEGLTTP